MNNNLKFIILMLIMSIVSPQTDTQRLIAQINSNNLKAKNLSLNTSYNEYMPFVSPNGNFLFFQSDRPDGSLHSGSSDIWISRRDTAFLEEVNFLPPQNLGAPINTKFLEGMFSLQWKTEKHWHLYFTSILNDKRDGVGETDIFFSSFKDGIWAEPSSLKEINTIFHDRMPYIVPDGSILLFSSNRPGGYGGEDIWKSEYDKQNKKWKKPTNAGGMINTKFDEISPTIHQNKASLYFSSNRMGGHGGFDIYLSQRKRIPEGEVWTKPKNLGNNYNSRYDEEGISLSGDGKYIYFSSNRAQGKGLYDIYQQKLKFEFQSKLSVIFLGNVYIKNTRKGIEANIKISNRKFKNNFSTKLPGGNFLTQLQSNDLYYVKISAPGYQTKQYQLNLKNVIHENQKKEKIFFLSKIEDTVTKKNFIMPMENQVKNKKIIMQTKKNSIVSKEPILTPLVKKDIKNMKYRLQKKIKVGIIYFSVSIAVTNKSDDEVKRIYSIWLKDKSRKITISGHSGREGNFRQQKKISRQRSRFIKEKFFKIGIPQEQLVNEWHGFSRPVSVKKDSISKAKNRRVEIYLQ